MDNIGNGNIMDDKAFLEEKGIVDTLPPKKMGSEKRFEVLKKSLQMKKTELEQKLKKLEKKDPNLEEELNEFIEKHKMANETDNEKLDELEKSKANLKKRVFDELVKEITNETDLEKLDKLGKELREYKKELEQKEPEKSKQEVIDEKNEYEKETLKKKGPKEPNPEEKVWTPKKPPTTEDFLLELKKYDKDCRCDCLHNEEQLIAQKRIENIIRFVSPIFNILPFLLLATYYTAQVTLAYVATYIGGTEYFPHELQKYSGVVILFTSLLVIFSSLYGYISNGWDSPINYGYRNVMDFIFGFGIIIFIERVVFALLCLWYYSDLNNNFLGNIILTMHLHILVICIVSVTTLFVIFVTTLVFGRKN